MPIVLGGGKISIPLDTFNPKLKIVITGDDSTEYTIVDTENADATVDYLINASVTKNTRDSLSRFTMQIANPSGVFTNKFDGGEVVEIYYDYNDASTLFFRGRIDNPKYGLSNQNGFFLSISGRDYPELADKTIVESFISANVITAMKRVLSNNYSDITLTYWENGAWTTTPTSVTDRISAEYQNQKGISVLSDLCSRADLDCRLEYDAGWKLRVHARNGKINTTESIAYGTNLLSLNDFGKDTLSVKNRIIAYGKTESDNILLLRTKNDLESQSNLWIKDEIITDSSIASNDICEEKANTVLNKKSTVYDTGRIQSVGLYSVNAGDSINISIPYLNINDNYRVQEITTNIGNGITSNLTITEKIPIMTDIFKRNDNTDELVSAYENLNNMTNSVVVWFDEQPSLMTLVNCEESEGRLQLESGQTTGTAILKTAQESSTNITECEFRRYENYNVNLDVLEVSNDNGVTWETINKKLGVHTFSSTGKSLKFKITLNRNSTSDTTPAYESIAVLYK